jgi:hypothetical protein
MYLKYFTMNRNAREIRWQQKVSHACSNEETKAEFLLANFARKMGCGSAK